MFSRILSTEIRVKSVADELLEMLGRLRFHLVRVQQRMVREANKHRQDVSVHGG